VNGKDQNFPNNGSFGWGSLIESREKEFRDRSLEIFCLFCGNENFGEKGRGV